MINSSFVEYKTLSSLNESLSLIEEENRSKKIPNTGLQISTSPKIKNNYSSLPLDRKKHGLIRRTALNRHRFRGTRLFQSSNEFHCRIQNGFYICVESIERTGPYRMKLGGLWTVDNRGVKSAGKNSIPSFIVLLTLIIETSTTGMVIFVVQTSLFVKRCPNL